MSARVFHLEAPYQLRAEVRAAIHGAVARDSVIIFPTDTIYGLGCHARSAPGLDQIRHIKGRSSVHPFSVHVSDLDQLMRFVEPLEPRKASALNRLLPGPYTIILPASSEAPPECVSAAGAIGLRIPASHSYLAVSLAAARPLVGTSVNRSGEPPLTDAKTIVSRYGDLVSLIVTTDEPLARGASTVIDWTAERPRPLRGTLPDWLLAV